MKNNFGGFSDRAIMRFIRDELPVPWPEELCHASLVFPKDYRMNEFPKTSEGDIWYDIPDDDYFAWLADYLPDNLPQLTRRQEEARRGISPITFGFQAGWHDSSSALRPNHDFPVDFSETADFLAVRVADGGFAYEEYKESVVDADIPEIVLLSKEEYILDDFGWRLVLQEERQQFDRYWPDFAKRDGVSIILKVDSLHNEPPDAGWRVYLGLMLQRIDSRAGRIKALKEFYREWHDILSK